MKITADTKTLAIFGDPVGHSISPPMQGAALRALGIDMVYLAFRVRLEGLGAAVEAIRALGIRGVNVTIPHKERVIEFLDDIDEPARVLGAVNTIVNNNGVLKGYNTDVAGFINSLESETPITVYGHTALVVGAGGAARAVVYGLAVGGARRIIIANRTASRAEALAEELSAVSPKVEFTAISLDDKEMESHLEKTDLLVNATSLGLKKEGRLDLPLRLLNKKAVVSDVVYTPMETELITEARGLGLATHGGLGMLVGQGAMSFELWTGREAPVEVMKEAALEALGLS